MKPWASYLLTFGAVFGVGMLWQAASLRIPETRPEPARALAQAPQANSARPPLLLPPQADAESPQTPGWEASGILAENYVSARYLLTRWFCRQKWEPSKKITLDATRNLREIYVFKCQNYELILMLWKISTAQTGFACRREPLKPLNQELLP